MDDTLIETVDIDFSTFVTEWRAEVIEHQNGKRYVAPFPENVTRPIQYGVGVKSTAVYMSQYQLIPYNRVEEQFQDQMGIAESMSCMVMLKMTSEGFTAGLNDRRVSA